MPTLTSVPREDEEQEVVVRYLDFRQVPRFRVPNETFTRSWKQKTKNKVLGVSAGVPDLFCVPNNQLIAIEMKRQKGSTTSIAQREWLETLTAAGIPAKVCKGAGEAIDFINTYLED